MIAALRRKMNPSCYQGAGRRGQYFEGWYYKLVARDGSRALAIIPGVFNDPDGNEGHAFIQVFDGSSNETHYIPFPHTAFSANDGVFDITVGDSRFTTQGIELDIRDTQCALTGTLRFSALSPWPCSLLSPGIMGWYSWVPFMECYHGVVSLDHGIEGQLMLNGRTIEFTGGRGYTEKDWGRSFPEAWIWCQCNHFSTPGSSLTGSVAIIPWIRHPFPGYIFGLLHEGTLHRFTTYTGAKLEEFAVDDAEVSCVLTQKAKTLELTATRTTGGTLRAPTLNGMTHEISESMSSTVHVLLSERRGGRSTVLMRDTGRHAGFEVAGDMRRLLTMHRQDGTQRHVHNEKE
ncbi:MAG: tocopherol cyclase family protein [Bacteroidota bacterium]|nr:tocopherol cyclase family protein [Bacteroidota bacterium]